MSRRQRRIERYGLAGKPVVLHERGVAFIDQPSEVAIAARRKRIDRALRDKVSDHTGIGWR